MLKKEMLIQYIFRLERMAVISIRHCPAGIEGAPVSLEE
jgi:hypothetical protein